MKKPILLVALLIIITLLSGCTSLSTWMKSNVEGVPIWVYERPASRTQISIVAKGDSDSEAKAKVLAYESLLQQISNMIGEDVTPLYMAQLTKSKTIDRYRLKISQEFVKKEENNVSIWILATAERSLIEQARTAAELSLLEREKEIEKYDKEAAKNYRENKDLLALNGYIKMATLATLRSKYTFENSVAKIKNILQKLNLSISQTKEELPITTVTLRRGARRLSARVKEAAVVAHYFNHDAMGNLYEAHHRFVTDNSGQFVYRNLSPTLVRSGQICFELDLKEALEPLKEINRDVYEELVGIVEGKKVCFSYFRDPIVAQNSLVVAIGEYSLRGQLLDSNTCATAVKEYFEKDEIEVLVENGFEQEEQLFEFIDKKYSPSFYLVYGNVGITQSREGEHNSLVAVSGEINLINRETKALIGSTQSISAVGIGSTLQEAQDEAFYRLGLIATSLINRFLYR
ncbi:MAG: hypothetical protein WDA17_00335 [Sphaerochaetaceae bacterium]